MYCHFFVTRMLSIYKKVFSLMTQHVKLENYLAKLISYPDLAHKKWLK